MPRSYGGFGCFLYGKSTRLLLVEQSNRSSEVAAVFGGDLLAEAKRVLSAVCDVQKAVVVLVVLHERERQGFSAGGKDDGWPGCKGTAVF